MQANDDEALLRACRQGDPEAWETFLRRYQRLIYAIPRRSGLSQDEADEVFQRVCVTFLKSLDRIEQPERIRAWLATTARRESWRMLRRQTTTIPFSEHDDTEEFGQLVDGEPLPDEVFERLERQHTVRDALSTLDERCRTLLTLLFYRSTPPPYAEVAAAIGVREGSIGPTRARCLEKLQRILEKRGL